MGIGSVAASRRIAARGRINFRPVTPSTPRRPPGPYFAARESHMREDRKMHADPATVEVPVLNLPPDLVNEVNRASSGKNKKDALRVESFRPSIFGRLVEKLVGPKDK
jgi:hypothetical protein